MKDKGKWGKARIPEFSETPFSFLPSFTMIFILPSYKSKENVFEHISVFIVRFVWYNTFFSKIGISGANVIKIKQIISEIVIFDVTDQNIKGAKSVVKTVCRFESSGQAAKKVEQQIVKNETTVCIVFTYLCCYWIGLFLVLITLRRFQVLQM